MWARQTGAKAVYLRWKTWHRHPKWAQPGVVIEWEGKRFPLDERGIVTYSAQVVETHREGGKVRQRVVAHLGSIPEYLIGEPLARVYFWDPLYRRLCQTGLPKEQHQEI